MYTDFRYVPEGESKVEKEQKEWWLFGVMAALVAVVVLVAWMDVPAFDPPTVTYQSGETTTTPTATFTISLNTATVQDLMRLNGLGKVTAERIVAYRNEHGLFYSVDELLEVDGIGEKKLDAWRPYLTL